MNSQGGAVFGSTGERLGLHPRRCGGIEANCWGTDVGGMSGDDARVVPDQNEGTGEDGDATLGTCSHLLIAIVGMLLCAKPPRSIPLGSKEVANVVSRFIGGGVSCQLKFADAAARMVWSMLSMPCIGAFTCAASCASSWCIRPSSASLCSLDRYELHVIT